MVANTPDELKKGQRYKILWAPILNTASFFIFVLMMSRRHVAKVSVSLLFLTAPIKILSRLTLVVSDPSHCNILRSTSTNIKFYDIFAVFPKSGKLFHVACTTLDVDIVCINVTEKLPFYIKRPSVNVAIDRGIYFELIYVPAIKDSTMRRYTVSNALSLMQICRGKVRLKMSRFPLQLRGPYDVANLGWLFGLSESNAKAAVSTNGRAVLLHGGKLEQ
uniref:Ribonuclease P/MRP subunit p30 n=1 Tax=Podarcis muralis TaxID=64176 RepID=A0A670HNZ8_PODMU